MKGQEPADSDCPDFARSRPASNVQQTLTLPDSPEVRQGT